MKSIFNKQLRSIIALGMALSVVASCSEDDDDKKSSSQFITISGIAATGTALGNRSVSIHYTDASTSEEAGVTNAAGAFQVSLDRSHLPAIIRVERGTGFSDLVTTVPKEITANSTLHVNPITTKVSQDSVSNLSQYTSRVTDNLSNQKQTNFQANGAEYINEILGANIEFDTYYKSSEFVARKVSEATVSSPAGVILETLEDRAISNTSVTDNDLMTYLQQVQSSKLLEDNAFQIELSANLSQAGISDSDSQSKLNTLGVNDTVSAHIKALNTTATEVKQAVLNTTLTDAQKTQAIDYALRGAVSAVNSILNYRGTTLSTTALQNVAQNVSDALKPRLIQAIEDNIALTENELITIAVVIGQQVAFGAAQFDLESTNTLNSSNNTFSTLVNSLANSTINDMIAYRTANSTILDETLSTQLKTSTVNATSTTLGVNFGTGFRPGAENAQTPTTLISTTTTTTSTTTSTSVSPTTTVDCRNPNFPPSAGDTRPQCTTRQ